MLVLGIHADGTLVLTSLLGSQNSLEGVVVAFMTRHLQRLDVEHVLLAVLVDIDVDLLQSDGIIKALLVDDITQIVLLACLETNSRNARFPSTGQSA